MWERNMETDITICKTGSQCDSATQSQELCISLEGWDGVGDGREVPEARTYVCLWLIHVGIWRNTVR